MNPSILSCPEFHAMDRAIIEDFTNCMRDGCEEIESCIKALNLQGGTEYVNGLFRALHSLKGNCQMVGLEPFTEPLHRIEELVSKIRSHQIVYTSLIGEFLLGAVDEVVDQLIEIIETRQTSNDRRLHLCRVCDDLLRHVMPYNITDQFQHAITALGKKEREDEPEEKAHKVLLEIPVDGEFMRNLALQIDSLSIYRKDRSNQIVLMTETLNEALGFPVNAEQLKAAAWMHDIGMCFIPHNIFNKEGSLSREEIRKIQEHVVIGSQFLLRFGGWEEAARMVLDHHERFDGSGYPNGVKGAQIHPGAHMLAIVDTYCAITSERSDRSFKKSLLSAISEINANSETQFDPAMVGVFNTVVRKIMMK